MWLDLFLADSKMFNVIPQYGSEKHNVEVIESSTSFIKGQRFSNTDTEFITCFIIHMMSNAEGSLYDYALKSYFW